MPKPVKRTAEQTPTNPVQQQTKKPLTTILEEKNGTPPLTHEGSDAILEGDIAADHSPDHFRIYPNPTRRHLYFLVHKKDVIGMVHEWTPGELAQGGFAGQQRYRVAVPHGTVVHSVLITSHRMGEGQQNTNAKTAQTAQALACACNGPDPDCAQGCSDTCGNCSTCCNQ